MSRSGSPLITDFFKPQRKRPRASIGKDEGLVSVSKKLMLEEGIFSRSSESATPPPPPPTKISGCAETSAKIVVRDENPTPDKSVVVAEVEGPSQEEINKNKGAAIEKSDQATLSSSSSGEVLPPSSPVKFLKVGSLSPAKKSKKKTLTTEQVAKLLKNKTKLSDLKSALEGINHCAQKITEFRRTVAEANAKASPVKNITDSPSKSTPRRRKKTSSTSTTPSSAIKSISPAYFYSPAAAERDRELLGRLSASKVGSPSKLVGLNSKVKKRLFDEEPKSKATVGDDEPKPIATAVPAYQRFHNLAQKTPIEEEKGDVDMDLSLPLPFNFKILKELFIAVETVVTIMKGRKEIITFPKVKANVLELVRKVALREKHLAQMLTVLPGCYTLSLEKIGKETHIRICIEEENLTPSVICTRRKDFHTNLLKICEKAHTKFLTEKLVPPIIIPDGKQITRWHPRFNIDEVPDIKPENGILPVKPEADKLSSAREVIARAQNILENANPKMKEAVKNMLEKQNQGGSQEGGSGGESKGVKMKLSSSASASTLKGLKGVSQSLLEKIRNREREKLLIEMTRSPAESKKLLMIKRLPNFVKIIRNLMVAEKKVALPFDIVVDRVSHSLQSMSKVDTSSHLRFLVTVLPNWIKVIKLSHSELEYIKIDKLIDINDLQEELNEIIKKHSS
ncbi:unnamed protein product [Orchesella dallaii]|uniref:CDT1 Geminin-binding domain-containing protein n=1 Tax=Orchesella dallaii TaxID=48710 RepID=A0ABP1QC94_9HEXA